MGRLQQCRRSCERLFSDEVIHQNTTQLPGGSHYNETLEITATQTYFS